MPEFTREQKRKAIARLMLAEADEVSKDAETARAYLLSQGLDPDEMVKEGMRRINEILESKNDA